MQTCRAFEGKDGKLLSVVKQHTQHLAATICSPLDERHLCRVNAALEHVMRVSVDHCAVDCHSNARLRVRSSLLVIAPRTRSSPIRASSPTLSCSLLDEWDSIRARHSARRLLAEKWCTFLGSPHAQFHIVYAAYGQAKDMALVVQIFPCSVDAMVMPLNCKGVFHWRRALAGSLAASP